MVIPVTKEPANNAPMNAHGLVIVATANIPDAAALVEIIQQQRDLHEEKRLHLLERKKTIFPTEKEKHENYGHYLILAHAINRETEYANWLTDVLEESNRKK